MKEESIRILINHDEYNRLFDSNGKKFAISTNFDNIIVPESLIDAFIKNNEYMDHLKDALSKREEIDFVLEQDNLVLLKKTLSPVSIVLAIKLKEDTLEDSFKREFKVLLNKINISSYLSKSTKKTFNISVDNKNMELSYNDILDVILDSNKYYEFVNSKSKYMNLTKVEFVYVLKEFMIQKRIFTAFDLDIQTITFYKSLIQMFDTYAINKNLETDFKYSTEVSINQSLESAIIKEIPKNISVLEKTIYIYMNLFEILTYDLEFVDDDVIKKHKDMTRVEDVNSKNNRVFSYEFSCIFAKFLEKMNIKIEYNDKYIIARINDFLVKYKSITPEFNLQKLSELDIIKGVTLLNDNKNTKNDFNKSVGKIYNNLYQKKVNLEILKMPFNKLLIYYKKTSSKISIPFDKKYEIFLKLISNVVIENNAIGYIYELKSILFTEDELNTYISFATIAERQDNKVSPAVIVTTNSININLYNSNKYIYYNPTKKIEEFTLNGIRKEFFNGRFKYVKNSKDNIIGVENIC